VACFLPGAGIVLFEMFQSVIVVSCNRKVFCPLGYEPCSQVDVYKYFLGVKKLALLTIVSDWRGEQGIPFPGEVFEISKN
jgi:hypothetical protein